MKIWFFVGATCAIMDLDTATFETLITNMFTKKVKKL